MKKKHKWWETLIYKYKYVEYEKIIKEYKHFRLWFVIFALIISIIISPIIIVTIWIMNLKSLLTYPMGKDGYEEYVFYDKDK